jgi:hypothetical protein
MYSRLISKMCRHFSELGSIIYSKSCDFYNVNEISRDDITMYYDVLNTPDVEFPEKVSKNNHIACCLYYLSKEDKKYYDVFLNKFLANLSFNTLKTNEENLILIFNIIEFDKTFLNSGKDHIIFLYKLLRSFCNFPTNLDSFILYKYYRGYLKFKIGEYENTNKEYFEIVSELSDQKDQNYLLRYIKVKNDLLKLKLYNKERKNSKKPADNHEFWTFLKTLYEEVKKSNQILALKLGFDLFSSYFETKSYNNCIHLLVEMKKLLKKELLKGTTTLKDGIDYYLAISSRLGYIGILLDDKNAITSAIKRIRKTLDIMKNDKDTPKIKKLTKAYTFILAILEISLNKKTDYDIKTLAGDFQNTFLPDLSISSTPLNYLVNEENKDSTILNLRIINNMNPQIEMTAKEILNRSLEQIAKKNNNDNPSLFLNFILAVHDKVNQYCNSYITDESKDMRRLYKAKIENYTEGAINFVYKLLDDEPLLYTKYVKGIIINIISAYTHLFIYEKNTNMIGKEINIMDDLKKKLNIEPDLPANALINKIKGDFWFFKKDFKAAASYYENSLSLFDKKDPHIPAVLFNIGCAYFFYENKQKAIHYLNRSVSEYNKLLMERNIFGFTPNFDSISKKIQEAKYLLSQLS